LPDASHAGLAEFRRAVRAALNAVPTTTGPTSTVAAGAEGAGLWRALGHGDVLAGLYGGDADSRPSPDRLGVLLTELDARYQTGPVLSVSVQAATALPVLAEGAASDISKKVRDGSAGGEMVLALAATDGAGSGSDLIAAATTARISDTEVVVDGGKRWITNACTADYALVLARHRPAKHFTSFVWVLVPMTAPGVGITPACHELFGGAGIGHLRFEGVRVTSDHVVGQPGRAMASFARHIGTERLAGGLWALAIGRRVLADTRQSLLDRQLNGKAALDNDAIRERFARCLVELWRLDAACARHVESWDRPDAMLSGMLLKTAAAASLQFIVGECVQLRGGDAFADAGLARLSAEVAAWSLAGGATGAMLAGIAGYADELLAVGRD
jgi:acyl-CoA dehydrogenase